MLYIYQAKYTSKLLPTYYVKTEHDIAKKHRLTTQMQQQKNSSSNIQFNQIHTHQKLTDKNKALRNVYLQL